ncbi:MAG TPA: PAS domain S-box protein, partial [Kofleriaceae bacterium]|nr:PAS domain S-box protein [Kofleriaceae bacterium]
MPPIDLNYQQLLDAAPDGIIVCDETSKILLVNKQVEHMFGYTRDELIGSTIEKLVPMSARARHGKHVSAYASAPRLRPMGSGLELHGQRKDGTELPVEISLSPV